MNLLLPPSPASSPGDGGMLNRPLFTATGTWTPTSPVTEVDGCDECNRSEQKPWPIFTINYYGVEVCVKCLAPMNAPRKPRVTAERMTRRNNG